ncbi:CLUMA_CG006292, isoform A [Clunio marinus]|uniref:CLUMA_CG006292, isoform A n=1 Tax=Clunio marinus TaxID=568069 RepID=A0A1J1HXN4_9DIPT|nr:CLUMA_CG006292, isoform A [Clunio marinus]
MSKKAEGEKQFQFLQKYLNNARKESKSKIQNKCSSSTSEECKKDEDWLTKKAIQELEKEMNINKVKRETFGSVTMPKTRTNKRFLESTLSHCLSHNKREQKRNDVKSTDKLKELERYHRMRKSKQKFGKRKHEYKKPEKRKSQDSSSSEN